MATAVATLDMQFVGRQCWTTLFLRDVEVHRFLVALPVLVAAELVVHLRIRLVVRRFVETRIVLPQDLARFDSAIPSLLR